MVHRTYRRLDEPAKLLGYSIGQWLALIVLGGGLTGGLDQLGVLGERWALSLLAFAIGVPAFLWRVSEHGRPSIARRLRDAIAALTAPRRLHPGAGRVRVGILIEPDGQTGGEAVLADGPAEEVIPWA